LKDADLRTKEMISRISDNACGIIRDNTENESSSDDPYEPNSTKGERRRIQNRLNQRARRKKLKVTTSSACKKKNVSTIG
jgi:hypothetical protein